MKTTALKRVWILVICFVAVTMTACNHSSQDNSKVESQIQSSSGSQLLTDSLALDNMNLSDAEIIIPERDEYHRLEFACEPFTATNSVKYFQEAYEIYFGETVTTAEMLAFGIFTGIPQEDIFHTYSYNVGESQLDVYFDALPKAKFSDVEYVRALNDRCYMDLNYAYIFEIYNREFINELVGDTSGYEFSWRPSFDGSYCGAMDADEDCTYSLYGTDISLQEAFTFAEDYFSNNDLGRINSSLFTYRREEAEVYRFGESNYGYYMWLKPCYDGIPVGAYNAFPVEPQIYEGEQKQIINCTIKCLMARDDALDWIWSCGLNYNEPTEKEVYTSKELLTMEEAAVLASEALTDGITFDISKVQLYYAFGEMYEDSGDIVPKYLFIEPSWQFVMPANSSLYQRIIVDVSAINGDVVVRYE